MKTGLRNTNRLWLISSAAKLASDGMTMRARFRSAYPVFS